MRSAGFLLVVKETDGVKNKKQIKTKCYFSLLEVPAGDIDLSIIVLTDRENELHDMN